MIYTGKIQAILVYEGVRAEESEKRSNYMRITRKVNSNFQSNAEVILRWNLTEVFLYLFYRDININKGYRYGLNRVGCSICPFASEWTEFILNRLEGFSVNDYIDIIRDYIKLSGFHNEEKLNKYIAEGQWKKRAGGRDIDTKGTMLDFIANKLEVKAVIKKPRENFLEWIKTTGDVFYKEKKGKIFGELRVGKENFTFKVQKKDRKEIITFPDIGRDIIIQSKIKKVLYKTTYCVHCGACEVECPTGALRVIPEVKINPNLCVHCTNCLDFAEKGCLVAKSVGTTIGGNNMKSIKIATSRYQTFGLRRDWLLQFLRNTQKWFEDNNLGNRQKEAVITWLKDAKFLDNSKMPTDIAKMLKVIIDKNELLVWVILIVNCYYNSTIIKWYFDYIEWQTTFTTKELIENILSIEKTAKRKTAQNSISS